jgi:hypothetical protein
MSNGRDCKCFAKAECECGCGADWSKPELVWSPTPPSTPGKYLMRYSENPNCRDEAIDVVSSPKGLRISQRNGSRRLSLFCKRYPDARFAGPITPPAD